MALTLSPAGRRYGLFRDNPFHPARTLRAAPAPSGIVLPPSAMELCSFKGPTRDQGNEGSCSGQAGASKVDLDYRQFQDGWGSRAFDPNGFQASAEFVYLCNLIADGDLGEDVGSTIHQTAITLSQKGACLNTQMPYSDKQYSTPPVPSQYIAALYYRMDAYHYLPDLNAMKACLAPSAAGPGRSFIFGILVYESFEEDWSNPGHMPMPDIKNEMLLGGHAQHVIGYDDTVKLPDGNVGGLFVQNSWGKDWGINAPGHHDGGCYWLSYAFVNLVDPVNGPCVSDAWINHNDAPWK